jgi:MFS transporter, DHA1 family, multidrug resistance protein
MKRRPPLWLVVLITISSTMGMHMFLPALPDAARALGAGAGQMQMTISIYIAGLGIGQLVYGPLSDAWGRRRVLMAGLALYVIGSIFAALSPTVEILLCARLLQSLGACAGVAIGRAIVRDTSTDEGTVRSMGLLGMLMSANPVLAPMVGGAVTESFGWRANFVVLGILGAVTLGLVSRMMQETGRPSGRFQISGALRDYLALSTSRQYASFAIGGGFLSTSPFAFLTAAPFIFTRQLNQTVQMAGVYSGMVLIGLFLGNGLSSLLSRRVRSEHVLRAGTMISLLCCAAFLSLVLAHGLTVSRMVGVLLLMTFGVGLSNPPAIGKAMAIDPRLFGSAAGLYGSIQMAAGAITSSLTALGTEPALAAAIVMSTVNLVVIACFEFGMRGRVGSV